MYLPKLQNVFVKIAKCICPNCKMYVSSDDSGGDLRKKCLNKTIPAVWPWSFNNTPHKWMIHNIFDLGLFLCEIYAKDEGKESHFQPQSLHCRAVGEPCSCPSSPKLLIHRLDQWTPVHTARLQRCSDLFVKTILAILFCPRNMEKFSWKYGLQTPPCVQASFLIFWISS